MSIIFRYLIRQVMVSMVAVSGILLLVFMSGRFIKYLAGAAEGKIAPGVLFEIMAYRFPGFLSSSCRWGCSLAYCSRTGVCTWKVK